MKNKVNIKTMIRKIVREEVAMAIQEVITELKQPTQQTSQTQRVQKPIVENKQFSNNSVLNNVLNETANFSPPIAGDTSVAGDVVSNTNTVDQGVSLETDLLNKDYSKILKKSMEKSNQKQGV